MKPRWHSARRMTELNPRRRAVLASVLMVFVFSLWPAAGWAGQSQRPAPPPGGYTTYVAPHSHMDMVWYWTYDKTEVMAIKILRQALEMLKKDVARLLEMERKQDSS